MTEPLRGPTKMLFLCCQYCSYMTRFTGNLAKHVRTHTGERPFSCHYCAKRFASKSNFNTHLATHMDAWDGLLHCPGHGAGPQTDEGGGACCSFSTDRPSALHRHFAAEHKGEMRGEGSVGVVAEVGASETWQNRANDDSDLWGCGEAMEGEEMDRLFLEEGNGIKRNVSQKKRSRSRPRLSSIGSILHGSSSTATLNYNTTNNGLGKAWHGGNTHLASPSNGNQPSRKQSRQEKQEREEEPLADTKPTDGELFAFMQQRHVTQGVCPMKREGQYLPINSQQQLRPTLTQGHYCRPDMIRGVGRRQRKRSFNCHESGYASGRNPNGTVWDPGWEETMVTEGGRTNSRVGEGSWDDDDCYIDEMQGKDCTSEQRLENRNEGDCLRDSTSSRQEASCDNNLALGGRDNSNCDVEIKLERCEKLASNIAPPEICPEVDRNLKDQVDSLCENGNSMILMPKTRKEAVGSSVGGREGADGLIDSLVKSALLYRCVPCNILFPEYSMYLLHAGLHGNDAEFQCHFCQEAFGEKFSFLSHFVRCPHDARQLPGN